MEKMRDRSIEIGLMNYSISHLGEIGKLTQ